MNQIISFNQVVFLSNVMEDALKKGSCTVMSAYFVKLALMGANISEIGSKFKENDVKIVALQQEAVNLHKSGWDGYSYVLNEIGLSWSSDEYTDPNGYLHGGDTALCLICFENRETHTIAILYHKSSNLIYMFDPNKGIYEFDASAWYHSDFHKFINETYSNVKQFNFKNVK